MSAKNKQIVDKVNAAFAENNVDGFLTFCTDDVEWTMVGDRTVKGKEPIRAWMKSIEMGPPQFTIDAVVAEGDLVVVYGNVTMKDKDQKVVPYAYCDIYRFRNGKIGNLKSFVINTAAKAATT